ncbi:hypothetical protein SAM23877_6129 [Streptomyces ambofaciens ATCC 23877]|uniref:Uncharacterized protein n=1 Tax=Streptomyces ambofaciens (strain ATCC 23877 / 3486 / DSM 40053 / JCM 4204 / NBRC 12836 / NRRL B-2516) TaxID=278992 RepID=A0A0K2B1L9_STRA7|nr:hypothetical protein [Streptomyces ambofaciens]AKZ59174.1 hypothetical protein SAM23877_6129 [Streptomyces ambofaciens ATCC 23877]WNA15367.1 hypothetical protein SAMYPH_36 [Streptomyces phage Samy]
MSKYGEGVREPFATSGLINVSIEDYDGSSHTSIHPDEARLLGLRLIKMADEAEAQEW